MKRTFEYRTVAVRYIRAVPDSTVVWRQIVKWFEKMGFMAIPRYESKSINELEFEHEIDVYAPMEKIVGVVRVMQTHATVLFPWVTKIYIKLKEGD